MRNYQWVYGLLAGVLAFIIMLGDKEIIPKWVFIIPIPLGCFLGYLCGIPNKRKKCVEDSVSAPEVKDG